MERSFEDIFLTALVTSLEKNAKTETVGGLEVTTKDPEPSKLPESTKGIAVGAEKPTGMAAIKRKLLETGKTVASGAHQTGTAAKGIVGGAARKLMQAWRTKGLPGKAAAVGVPALAAGGIGAGAIGAEKLIQALKGKKKEE